MVMGAVAAMDFAQRHDLAAVIVFESHASAAEQISPALQAMLT
jgi:hypothetical protein